MPLAVFLDRDNTLIVNDGDLGDPNEVTLIQGAAAALASLRGLGYTTIVVSNQGGVARGKYTEADVEAVNQRINRLAKANSGGWVDRFYYCPYHPQGTVEKYRRKHPWRKPAPGMLLQARDDLDLDLAESWMIGDQIRDVEAGEAAGVRTILLTPDAERLTPLKLDELRAEGLEGEQASALVPTFTARNLVEAVRIIAQQRKPEVAEQIRDESPIVPPPRIEHAGPTPPANAIRLDGRSSEQPDSQPTEPIVHTFRPWNAPIPPPPPEAPPEAPPVAPPEIEETVEDVQPRKEEASEPLTLLEAPSDDVAAEAPEPVPLPMPSDAEEDQVESHSLTSDAAQNSALLRQILHELRRRRGAGDEFSYTRMLAIILLFIAVVCFMGAFFMSGEISSDGASLQIFFRWVSSAVLMTLAAIAVLLFKR